MSRGFVKIRASSRQGVSYARNFGIGAARAEKILFCDADDGVSAYWVAHGWEILRTNDLFSGSARNLPDDVFVGSVESIREALGDRGEFTPLSKTQDETSHPVLIGGDFGIMRALALQMRGFDKSMPVAGEDNDVAIRLQRAVVPIVESSCSRIGYRTRVDGPSKRRVAYRAAKAHAFLCARYGLWQEFPHVQGVDWVIGPVRRLAAAAKMVFSPRRRDWQGLTSRMATNLGFLVGFLIFGLFWR